MSDFSALPRPLQWLVVLLFVCVVVYAGKEILASLGEESSSAEVTEIVNNSIRGLENLQSGVEQAKEVDDVIQGLPKPPK